ncbi:winged helix-turn-helix transcriptional regulator [Natronobiforma cellulositropha]|uniref:winged helix-turn-helix transcriptional regulator n=1 Tax=Natronobiforma cellulositropha TaxID=1679076 RepID=UPI0021D5CC16|nr:helix-turn-helix domain-containing protein [Natronobiforma cellulositropha]
MSANDRQEEIEKRNQSACPTIQSLNEIGEIWRLNILHDLMDEEKRFNELKRSTNARSRTLSNALDSLIENGYVKRRTEEAAPIAVFYSLSEKGRALKPVFDELDDWAADWLDDVPADSV